jgi:hypothetical protein
MLNLLVTARGVENPQQLMLDSLVFCATPMLKIGAKTVADFVAKIRDPSPSVSEDLALLRDTPNADSAVVHSLRLIYFATQECHLFGWFREGGFFMEKRYPICSYFTHNVPCPYAWFELNTVKWNVKLLKHTLPDCELDFKVSVQFPGDAGTQRFIYSIDYCACTPTSRTPSICLEATETQLECLLDKGNPELRSTPFIMLLSVNLKLSGAIMIQKTGSKSKQCTFLHSFL